MIELMQNPPYTTQQSIMQTNPNRLNDTNIIDIQTTTASSATPLWQQQLNQAISDPRKLVEAMNLDSQAFSEHIKARRLFAMRVPTPFVDKMKRGDKNDPLFKQVMPDCDEFLSPKGFTTDPLGEQQAAIPGLLHKYKTRVLIVFRGGCAINCRYCFRRHFPYGDHNINKQKLNDIIDYVKQNPQINEIILSGGDPLMAKDQHIQWFFDAISHIDNITRVRIHTRLPVVIPARITQSLTEIFANSNKRVIMVLHINHPNEIDQTLIDALKPLSNAKVTLLNQAVLLKDINDEVQTQVDLSERLFDANILPYYLHVLDRVSGASHFEVSEDKAKALMREMIKVLPGFLMPKLTREIAEQPSKTPIWF